MDQLNFYMKDRMFPQPLRTELRHYFLYSKELNKTEKCVFRARGSGFGFNFYVRRLCIRSLRCLVRFGSGGAAVTRRGRALRAAAPRPSGVDPPGASRAGAPQIACLPVLRCFPLSPRS